jgi:hypothetical protein
MRCSFEGPVAAAADDPNVAGAQPAAQLRQHAALVIASVNLTARHHIPGPPLADETGRSGFRQLERPSLVHVAQCVDGAQQRGGGRPALKGEGCEKGRRPAAHGGVVLAQPLAGIEILRARQRFRFGDADAKALPRDDCRDRVKWVLPGLTCGNQSGADARIKANLLVNGAAVGLKGADMPRLGLGEHGPDEPFEQIDGLIGQSGVEIESDRDQGCEAALPLIAGDMLCRCPAGLTSELRQARLMHAMPPRGIDTDRPDMVQALDQAEHRGGLCRLGHLAQPDKPALPGLRPALRQGIELAPLPV